MIDLAKAAPRRIAPAEDDARLDPVREIIGDRVRQRFGGGRSAGARLLCPVR